MSIEYLMEREELARERSAADAEAYDRILEQEHKSLFEQYFKDPGMFRETVGEMDDGDIIAVINAMLSGDALRMRALLCTAHTTYCAHMAGMHAEPIADRRFSEYREQMRGR